MFKKINILVNNLGANQNSFYLISSLNKIIKNNISPVVFYETVQKHHIPPLFPTTNIVNAYGQNGVMISTSIETTLHLLSFPAQNKCLYYLWDIPWGRPERKNSEWKFYNYIFKSLPIVTRSQSHKELIESCFDIEVLDIMENWNKDKLLEITNELFKYESK